VVELAVLAAQYDGDSLLAGQLGPQALPAQVNPLALELNAQGVDQVVGQHRDKQVAVDPPALVMVEGIPLHTTRTIRNFSLSPGK
jgi:hypothetical protein